MGPVVTAHLVRSGFYPAGGGRFDVAIEPCSTLEPFEILHRGEIVGRSVRALIANLPRHIAEREIATALTLLNWSSELGCIEEVRGASGPGNVLIRTLKLLRHALTNADVIRNFLDVTIDHRDEAATSPWSGSHGNEF